MKIDFYQIASWQPKPFLCNDGRGKPLSKWFYRRYFPTEDSPVCRNWFGNKWQDVFCWLGDKFN